MRPEELKRGSTDTVYYYHADHLGTPRVMTNSAGAVAWRAAFHAFGYAEVDPSYTISNNLRLPGQYFDAETNLHYNWNRYYDPRTGRYFTPDPIGLEGGIDPFVYTDNNPVNWVDFLGLNKNVPPNLLPARRPPTETPEALPFQKKKTSDICKGTCRRFHPNVCWACVYDSALRVYLAPYLVAFGFAIVPSGVSNAVGFGLITTMSVYIADDCRTKAMFCD